jgi:hypothetical protein
MRQAPSLFRTGTRVLTARVRQPWQLCCRPVSNYDTWRATVLGFLPSFFVRRRSVDGCDKCKFPKKQLRLQHMHYPERWHFSYTSSSEL